MLNCKYTYIINRSNILYEMMSTSKFILVKSFCDCSTSLETILVGKFRISCRSNIASAKVN